MGGFISEKLSTLLDPERGAKLADRIQELLLFLNKHSLHKMGQKRNHENGDSDLKKKVKEENSTPAVETNPLSLAEVRMKEIN